MTPKSNEQRAEEYASQKYPIGQDEVSIGLNAIKQDVAYEAYLAGLTADRWIKFDPSDESTWPEFTSNYKYLVCVDGVPQHYTCMFKNGYGPNGWFKNHHAFAIYGITHWQPLPQIPSPEKINHEQ